VMQTGNKAGVVFRTVGGFFFVKSEGKQYRCVLRGTLKKSTEVLVGDRVVLLPTAPGAGVIEGVEERSNRLLRPPVANVGKALVVLALDDPPPNLNLLDRILVQVEDAGVQPVVCLNKIDLAPSGEVERIANELLRPYRLAGYKVYSVSSKEGWGIAEVRCELADSVTVLAGQSGVGKSSILNAVEPGLSLSTGEVSRRTKRGRHTTRQVELMPLTVGGWVVDTPGFSALELPEVEPEKLIYLFPELWGPSLRCRFPNCGHESERDCAVRQAVEQGTVASSRLASYLEMARELKERRRYKA
jgi:ribosome biogenesis GTPase